MLLSGAPQAQLSARPDHRMTDTHEVTIRRLYISTQSQGARPGAHATHHVRHTQRNAKDARTGTPLSEIYSYSLHAHDHLVGAAQSFFFWPSSDRPPGPCTVRSSMPPITESVWKK